VTWLSFDRVKDENIFLPLDDTGSGIPEERVPEVIVAFTVKAGIIWHLLLALLFLWATTGPCADKDKDEEDDDFGDSLLLLSNIDLA
jgi:hypothetical protein